VIKPRRGLAFAASLLALGLLAGCANDPLAEQYSDGTQANYISGEGVYKEFTPEQRTEPVEFSSVTDTGEDVSSADYAGSVYVVNFWFAGCPPCRLEAPDLQELSETYAEQGVSFLGVNTYDQPDTALAFARKFGVTYPSVIDANDVSVQYAFSGSVPPNAVPTTLVVDREGRVAARWSGLISDPSIVAAMIDRVLAEES
jgi:thiol-disulfide isomerase/thioredoxin